MPADDDGHAKPPWLVSAAKAKADIQKIICNPYFDFIWDRYS